MFGINKEEMEKRRAEHEARKMMSQMMSQMLLESDAPESVKLVIRIIDKAESVNDAVRDLVETYCDPDHIANEETLTKVLEYLELVEVGIRQFVDGTPFVADTEEDDEVC